MAPPRNRHKKRLLEAAAADASPAKHIEIEGSTKKSKQGHEHEALAAYPTVTATATAIVTPVVATATVIPQSTAVPVKSGRGRKAVTAVAKVEADVDVSTTVNRKKVSKRSKSVVVVDEPTVKEPIVAKATISPVKSSSKAVKTVADAIREESIPIIEIHHKSNDDSINNVWRHVVEPFQFGMLSLFPLQVCILYFLYKYPQYSFLPAVTQESFIDLSASTFTYYVLVIVGFFVLVQIPFYITSNIILSAMSDTVSAYKVRLTALLLLILSSIYYYCVSSIAIR